MILIQSPNSYFYTWFFFLFVLWEPWLLIVSLDFAIGVSSCLTFEIWYQHVIVNCSQLGIALMAKYDSVAFLPFKLHLFLIYFKYVSHCEKHLEWNSNNDSIDLFSIFVVLSRSFWKLSWHSVWRGHHWQLLHDGMILIHLIWNHNWQPGFWDFSWQSDM